MQALNYFNLPSLQPVDHGDPSGDCVGEGFSGVPCMITLTVMRPYLLGNGENK